jgi:hypothetical protein
MKRILIFRGPVDVGKDDGAVLDSIYMARR